MARRQFRIQASGSIRITLSADIATSAKAENFDYFTTTLTISPHKNSQILNEIGQKVAEEIGVKHLPSDFK